MNAIRNISAVLLLSSLALTALPAGAVSFHSVLNAQKNNSTGSDLREGPPVATHFCYLSSVGMEDTDSVAEIATCRVFPGVNSWFLEAHLNKNDDADVYCEAFCFNN